MSNDSEFLISIEHDNVATMPLLDVDTNTTTKIVTGPYFQKNNFRWYLRMPDEEEALTIPAPPGVDRKTVTFEPICLVIQGMLPMDCTGCVTRVHSQESKARPPRQLFHKWKPSDRTAIYPQIPIQMESLHIGEVIEVEGFSWRRGDGIYSRADLPPIQITYPMAVYLTVKLRWIPKKKPKFGIKTIQRFSGQSPEAAVSEAVAPGLPVDSNELDMELPDLDVD